MIIIYVDNISTRKLKVYLHQHFQIRNLDVLKYFCSIDVTRLEGDNYITLDMLKETGMLWKTQDI